MTVENIAQQFVSFLTTKTRDNGDTFTCTTDNAPDWVSDVICDLHGNMFPDDWTYATIQECAEYIAENGDDDSDSPEAEIYTARLLSWLSDYPNAVDKVDEGVEEMSGDFRGLVQAIQYAQASVIREIHYNLIQTFNDRAEQQEDEAAS